MIPQGFVAKLACDWIVKRMRALAPVVKLVPCLAKELVDDEFYVFPFLPAVP